MSNKVTEAQKRSVECPECGARAGKPCKGSRIPGPNTFGGGWGGPPDLDRSHDKRRQAYLDKMSKSDAKCRACGATLAQCNARPVCEKTNDCEHDIPGFKMHTFITPASAEES